MLRKMLSCFSESPYGPGQDGWLYAVVRDATQHLTADYKSVPISETMAMIDKLKAIREQSSQL